jgi:hypothetical protein
MEREYHRNRLGVGAAGVEEADRGALAASSTALLTKATGGVKVERTAV